MEYEHLITLLKPDERRGLMLQAEAVLGRAGAPISAERLEDLARRVIDEPQMTPYSLEWRYLIALELRRMAGALTRKPH